MIRHQDNARERVLDSFEDLLLERGSGQATLDAVAAQAGLTKGGLLYHFRSRAALVAGVVERFEDRTRLDLEQMRSAPEGAAANYLRIADYLASPLHRTTLALSQLSSAEPSAAAALNASREAELAALVEDVGDPAIARLTMLVAEGLCFQAINTPAALSENAAAVHWFIRTVLEDRSGRP